MHDETPQAPHLHDPPPVLSAGEYLTADALVEDIGHLMPSAERALNSALLGRLLRPHRGAPGSLDLEDLAGFYYDLLREVSRHERAARAELLIRLAALNDRDLSMTLWRVRRLYFRPEGCSFEDAYDTLIDEARRALAKLAGTKLIIGGVDVTTPRAQDYRAVARASRTSHRCDSRRLRPVSARRGTSRARRTARASGGGSSGGDDGSGSSEGGDGEPAPPVGPQGRTVVA